jgi:hypothetical protein
MNADTAISAMLSKQRQEEEAGEVWGSVLLCENVEIFLMMWRFTGFHLIEASLI